MPDRSPYRKCRSKNGPGPKTQSDRNANPFRSPVPADPDDPITKPGDLWLLGDHRLLCGDSGNGEDVDRLLNGDRVQLVHTDPPYNVNVQPRSNNAIAAGQSTFRRRFRHTDAKLRARDRRLANDCVSGKEFRDLLRRWFGQIARALEPGRAFYIWGGYANSAKYPPALEENDLHYSQAIIWVKEHPVPSRKDFMGNHEWCFYGWRKGSAHLFFGPKNATDVWSVKKVPWQRRVHLTEKPVELAIRALCHSSRPGETVLDLFAGSGSTLIAAQHTSRRALLMEVDAFYCDVIIERWRQFTGLKPKRQAKHR